VARLPLFAFAAVQAVLLPHLARTLADGEHKSFRSQLGVALGCTAALAAAGLIGTALIGPQVLQLLFGEDFELPRQDLVLMALATAVSMLALVLQPAVIALGKHRTNAIAWVSGVAVFALTLAWPAEVFTTVEIGLVLGAATTAAILGWQVVRLLPDGEQRDLDRDPALGRLGME
jgi:O-antigen/teichoic acid export membrane protein